ncbi:MAG: hypothetical protein L6R28_13855 [Planctomycetes bacterium]|nr:hypothetical protein [Planctomycetota bacterium]
MDDSKPALRRPLIQIHLISCLAVMIAAGGLLAVNFAGEWDLIALLKTKAEVERGS